MKRKRGFPTTYDELRERQAEKTWTTPDEHNIELGDILYNNQSGNLYKVTGIGDAGITIISKVGREIQVRFDTSTLSRQFYFCFPNYIIYSDFYGTQIAIGTNEENVCSVWDAEEGQKQQPKGISHEIRRTFTTIGRRERKAGCAISCRGSKRSAYIRQSSYKARSLSS